MKIALVSQPLDQVTPPRMNSIGIWTYEIARRLAKSNQVTVFTRAGISKRGEIGENVQTRYVRSMPNRWMAKISRTVDGSTPTKRPFFSSALYNLEYSLQIALEVMRQKCDIVHIQNYSQFVPIIRAFNPHVKIALHMRSEWLTQLDHALIAGRLEKTDLIFGISDYITNKIRQTFPEHHAKCFTIANGVDIEKFCGAAVQPVNNQRTILMVGRISPEKGIHVLLEAFRGVAVCHPDTRLVLVGPIASVSKQYIVDISDDAQVNSLGIFYEGNYRDYLERLIPVQLKDRVHFQGGVSYDETIGFYQNSHLLVNPSLSESFGRSLIEANACELPVIAARTGGMTEIIEPGFNGLLVGPDQAPELASAIELLLQNDPLRRQLGLNGRQRVLERYTWAKIVSDLQTAYCAAG